jgi:hypothetical protein
VAQGTRLSFSPNTTIEAVDLSQTFVDDKLHRLTRLISTSCDQYVQYFLTGTNTCSDYNLVGVSLPHHTPRPSQLTVLHFPPKSPTRSQVNQSIKFQLNQEVINPNSHEWDPPFDFYCTLSSKHSIANSKPPKGGLTRKYRKVDHNASTAPYNSYVLNAQPKYNIKQDSKIKDKEH